jgi:G3E family GTPase
MAKTLIACVGGFLGAGKTTALQAAARELIGRGIKVGIITNDQGSELIDTEVMRRSGLSAEEITGGCFCCKFDELATRAVQILKRERPDVILAEAVGSCTDLSATVYQPLRKYYSDRFELAPLSILVEPDKLLALSKRAARRMSDLVTYLYEKQIAEADLVVINKADLFGEEERAALSGSITALAGDIPVHTMSALTGQGVAGWVDFLLSGKTGGGRILELDYELYARAEAELGWLNATVELTAERRFSPREIAEVLVSQIQRKAAVGEMSIAHLKILVTAGEVSDRIALTDTYGFPRWSDNVAIPETDSLSLIINARVHSSPEELTKLIKGSVAESAHLFRVAADLPHLESFSPAAPKPQYRFAETY